MRNGWMGEVNFKPEFPPASVVIDMDLNNPDPVQLAIHELLHVVLSELVLGKFDESLEEVIVLSLDKYIYDWVKKSPTRLRRWQTVLDQKLAEAIAHKPPKTLEELATRPAE